MNIGICFISPATEVPVQFALKLARKVEEAGLHSFWVNDRICYDNLEPLAVLSGAAAVTHRIMLGTSILLLPTRQPAVLAKTLATIDILSKGRLILGVGVGNRVSDYTVAQVPFEQRGRRALESVQIIRRIWQGGEFNYSGEFLQLNDVTIGPQPYQRRSIPVWMGGSAEAVLKRTAQYADGYICATSGLRNFPVAWEKICDHAVRVGRNPDQIEKAALNFLVIAEDKSRAVAACHAYFERSYGKVPPNVETDMCIGPAPSCAEKLATSFEKGIHTMILGLPIPDLKQVDTLVERVIPQLPA